MIKVLLPSGKKVKSNIRGFWLDNGKIYYDYHKIKHLNLSLVYNNRDKIYNTLESLRVKHNQICLFFYDTDRQIAGLFYNPSRVDYFKEGLTFKHSFLSKDLLRYYLKRFNGFTIYNKKKYYKIEVWQ